MSFYRKTLASLLLGAALFSTPHYGTKDTPIKHKAMDVQKYETRQDAKAPIVYGYDIHSFYADGCVSESVAAFGNPEAWGQVVQ
ncbi:MAG: hypothetical protein HY514_02230 [Candidatus Aenigmarchaeota archaeon]|nr:hypothetical protein [Candidatus Aenigmarchaeota archaeon]